LLAHVRQLTFEGQRAGEGYFGRGGDDGARLVFQSEREPGNPFFQIYVMDLKTGDVSRVSPGHGKTTCAWIHPEGHRILFASTHDDPEARRKQQAEIKLRESGQARRYSWDFDENFDIYVYDGDRSPYTNLTNTPGYDAEGSYSPDGRLIAFASNRRAYSQELSEAEREKFQTDPAYAADIYLMNADGSDPRRLTTTPGYDGGPFFSPDGERICWRRFSEDGAQAEVMTMNLDGTDQRQLTRLGAMSWAPFYHPSGEYLIFTTNRHGFANFELYLVDAQAKSPPVRVTYTDGFDGLPVFSPDGRRLAWTTNRTPSKQSQIFLAEWNHARAQELLGLVQGPQRQLAGNDGGTATTQAPLAASTASVHTEPLLSPADFLRHVDYLCRDQLEGRLTGTSGTELATAYVASCFDQFGLRPAGDDATYMQRFEFTSGVDLGPNNSLAAGERNYRIERDWRPLAFSAAGSVPASPVVFAGYGMVAPADEEQEVYDSYVHLDVKDKWVMVFRFLPERVSAQRRQYLFRHASLRYKAMVARDKGARGLIVVSGPNSNTKSQLVPMRFDGSISGSGIAVVSVTDEVAQQWLDRSGKQPQLQLKDLQDRLDTGELVMGLEPEGLQLAASIDIQQVKRRDRNVLGRLEAGSQRSGQTILVGAHIDHLGRGLSGASLALDTEKEAIHYGADDNASGVAAMLQIAQYLARQKSQGQLDLRRDILFAAWSGEEMGLIGSNHFVKTFGDGLAARAPHEGNASSAGHVSLYPSILACVNMDMVGRLDKKLILQGVGSSSIWRREIERSNVPVGLSITLQEDAYLPTDATSFFMQGVPILSAFTGSHSDYHTPRDTPEKLNYQGMAQIAHLVARVTQSLATREEVPDYIPQAGPEKGPARAHLRAYLGTVPDYAESDVRGVKLAGVAEKGPAAQAGVRGGDVIVELAGKKIENIYDYTYAIEALKIGQPVKIVVERSGTQIELEVTPQSRE
jgi:Tol biopolymer transport system component